MPLPVCLNLIQIYLDILILTKYHNIRNSGVLFQDLYPIPDQTEFKFLYRIFILDQIRHDKLFMETPVEKILPSSLALLIVDRVFPESYYVTTNFPDREEAGTPNILGSITLGTAIDVLDKIGMENVLKDDMELTHYCMNEMLKIPEVVIYGCTDSCPREATISFNIKN